METKNSELSELYTALSKAQAAFPVVEKNRTAGKGSSFSYKYADITDIIEAIKPHLAANGLSFTQAFVASGEGLFLKTTIHHSSGGSYSSHLPMPDSSKMKPQDFGSFTTYMRRYGLGSLVGIASDEDLDGALPEKKSPAREVTETDKLANKSGWTINEKQIKRMFAIASSKGLSNLEVKALAEKHGHTGSSKDMLSNCYNAVCAELEAMPNKA